MPPHRSATLYPCDQYASILSLNRSSLFTAYLWPVQAQHRYGAARLLFANHRLDTSILCFAIASLIFATLALANPHNALLVRFFCHDVAALHISSLYQLRSLSAHCYRFSDRCDALLLHDVSMPFLLLAKLITTLLTHFHSFLLDRLASPFFCDAWIHCASPAQNVAFLFFGVAFHMTTKLLLCALVRVSVC